MLNVGIIDYGAGNIASVTKAIDYAGADPRLVSTAEEIAECDKLVLPGVGASGLAITKLRERNLEPVLSEAVKKQGKPLMGICVGMQLLAEDMYEFGHYKGLGWLPGKVISLKEHGIDNRPVPHMGWSDVSFTETMKDLDSRLGRHKSFYFAHSFTLTTDPDIVCSSVSYGGREMVAGIAFDNICAFQFHPEKSQLSGDILMQWFVNWEP